MNLAGALLLAPGQPQDFLPARRSQGAEKCSVHILVYFSFN
jgi:hypothetical protein